MWSNDGNGLDSGRIALSLEAISYCFDVSTSVYVLVVYRCISVVLCNESVDRDPGAMIPCIIY